MIYLLLLGNLLWLPLLLDVFDSSDKDGGDSSDPDPETPEPPQPPTEFLDFFGTDGPDAVDGTAFNDTLRGFNGNDDLGGFAGDDEITGGNGQDLLFGDDGNDLLRGNAGSDLVGGGAGQDSVYGGPGNDTVDGGDGADTLSGGSGNDSIYGDEAPRIGTGGVNNGDDLLYGDDGNDWLAGNGGIDTLIGGAGNDRIFDFDLAFYDGPNASVVDGGAGNDEIYVDAGSTLTGGNGNDLFFVHDSLTNTDVTEITDFTPGQDTLEFEIEVGPEDSGEISFVDFEDGTGAEIYHGDTLLARVTGAQGLGPDDINVRFVLEQQSGSYTFEDGANSSAIIANDSDNTILGGEGDDTISSGGYFSLGVNSQGGSDLLDGGAGDDLISASGGTLDAFFGNDENDLFYIQELGPDTIIGGEGDDTLLAANGGEMTGGSGADVFGVSQSTSAASLGFPFEPVIITDFDSAEDILFVDVRPQIVSPGEGIITVNVWEDETGSDVFVDGTLIARVTGGQTLTPANITTDDRVLFS